MVGAEETFPGVRSQLNGESSSPLHLIERKLEEAWGRVKEISRQARVERILSNIGYFREPHPDWVTKSDDVVSHQNRNLRKWLGRLYLADADANVMPREISDNPLLDLMTTAIATVAEDQKAIRTGTVKDWDLAVTFPPEKIGRFTMKQYFADKPSQYYAGNKETGEPEARTIIGFQDSRKQREVITALDLVARTVARNPSILKATLDQYNREILNDPNAGRTVTALGLLEILHNLDLLDDPHFFDFSIHLRDVVIEEQGSVEKLRELYSYRVVDREDFWEEVPEPAFNLTPKYAWWQERARTRAGIINEIKGITVTAALTEASVQSGGLNEAARLRALRNLQDKEMLEAKLAKVEADAKRDLLQRMKRDVLPIAMQEADPYLLADQIRQATGFFKTDRALSSKLRRVGSGATEYNIGNQNALNNPLFLWLDSLKDQRVARMMEQAAKDHPEEVLLLFKQVVFEAGRSFFSSREDEFLFNQDYSLAKPEGLIDLIKQLSKTAVSPSFKDIFMDEMKQPAYLGSLLAKPAIRERKRSLDELIYEWKGPFRIDRRKEVRPETIKKIKIELIGAVAALAVCGALYLNWPAISSLSRAFERRDTQIARVMARIDPSKDRTPYIIKKGIETGAETRPFYYGKILKLPEGYHPTNGSDFAFFPMTVGDEVFNFYDMGLPDFGTKTGNYDIFTAGAIDELEAKPPGEIDDLVYTIDNPGAFIMAPEGWALDRVYVQGKMPDGKKTPLGIAAKIFGQYLVYSSPGSDFPQREVIVADKESGVEYYPGRIVSFNEQAETYGDNNIYSNYKMPRSLLVEDTHLGYLHSNYLDDIYALRRASRQESWTKEVFLKKYSDLALAYAQKYAQYTDQYRFYQVGPDQGTYNTIYDIGDNPDMGYDCGVAAKAFDSFFQNFGIKVYQANGFILKVENGRELWGKVGHAKNILWLPDGRLVWVDMTPPVVEGKTPKEDMKIGEFETPAPIQPKRKSPRELLATKTPWLKNESGNQPDQVQNTIQIPQTDQTLPTESKPIVSQETIDNFLELANRFRVPLASVLGLYFLARGVNHKVKQRKVRQRIEEAFTEERSYSDMECRLVSAMTVRIAGLKYDDSFGLHLRSSLELLANYNDGGQAYLIGGLLKEGLALKNDKPEEAFKEIFESYYHPDKETVDRTKRAGAEITPALAEFIDRRTGIRRKGYTQEIADREWQNFINAFYLAKYINEADINQMVAYLGRSFRSSDGQTDQRNIKYLAAKYRQAKEAVKTMFASSSKVNTNCLSGLLDLLNPSLLNG